MSAQRASRAAVLAVILAVLGPFALSLTSPAEAASTGTVKGVVSLAGKPVRNAKVQLYVHLRSDADDVSREYARFKTVSTDSRGRYSIGGVKAGTWEGGPKYRYVLLVTDRSGNGAKTVRTYSTRKARTKTLDVALTPAVILTGSVTRSDGGTPSELSVTLSSADVREDSGPNNAEFRKDSTTPVRADGTFTVKGLAAGEYTLVVRGEAYRDHCYDFEAQQLEECDWRAGQDIVFGPGERRSLAPSVMTNLAPAVTSVTGRVTDPSGRALKGIEVRLRGVAAAPGVTRANGRFTYRGRPAAGEYVIRFKDPKNIWALGADADGVTRVAITPGQPVAGVDATLKSLTTVKHSTKGGRGTAKLAFQITRKASGSKPGGTLTVSYKGRSTTVTVKKGRATTTLTGLRAGTRAIVVEYSGTATTAGFSKRLNVVVR